MPQKQTGREPRASKGAEKPRCHIHDAVQDWELYKIRQKVCVNDLELIRHTDGKYYCLFHLPTKDKDIITFEELLRARLVSLKQEVPAVEGPSEEEGDSAKRYDFRYLWFPSFANFGAFSFDAFANFKSATFSDDGYFSSATFSADADFSETTFSVDADFSETTFSARANFDLATFSDRATFAWSTFFGEAVFDSATFSAYASFTEATFSTTVSFAGARFSETSQISFEKSKFYGLVDFKYAIFAGYVAFEGKWGERVFIDRKREDQEAVLNLQGARLEKPERISFYRVCLFPNWFVNSDSRKMVFTDVIWKNLAAQSSNANIIDEIKNLEKRNISGPGRLLEIACRQLAVNAEENNRYEEAAKFRYMTMETKRLEDRWRGQLVTLNWWYRFSSGYGEDWKRAAVVLIGVLVLFGVLYALPLSKFDYGEKKEPLAAEQPISEPVNDDAERFRYMGILEGPVHSLYVAALQRPEPKAANTLTKFFVIMETILGPLQAALLALAIRRKFMR